MLFLRHSAQEHAPFCRNCCNAYSCEVKQTQKILFFYVSAVPIRQAELRKEKRKRHRILLAKSSASNKPVPRRLGGHRKQKCCRFLAGTDFLVPVRTIHQKTKQRAFKQHKKASDSISRTLQDAYHLHSHPGLKLASTQSQLSRLCEQLQVSTERHGKAESREGGTVSTLRFSQHDGCVVERWYMFLSPVPLT